MRWLSCGNRALLFDSSTEHRDTNTEDMGARVQTKATVRVTMSVFFLSGVFTARSMKIFSLIGFVFSLV